MLKLITVKGFVITVLLLAYTNVRDADTLMVKSPSGKINIKVWMDKQLTYCVFYDSKKILEPSLIDLLIENNGALSINTSIVCP